MCLVTVYYVLEHWNYPLKNILGELGCHIANLLRQTGSLQIQFHSFIMATTRYIFLFHDNLLLRFNLTTKVSAITYFENSTIVAIKNYIVTFLHVKSIKLTSVIKLRRMKKIRQMVLTCRKIKNKS